MISDKPAPPPSLYLYCLIECLIRYQSDWPIHQRECNTQIVFS